MLTALALLLSGDKISLEDSITKFIPGLKEELYQHVTIGALADHSAGLGRFGYVGDLSLIGFNVSTLGLPTVNNTLPGCDSVPGGSACTDAEVLAMFNHPSYAPHSPNSGPMYSNIGYNLLGMALEAVHGKSYEEVIHDLILKPLEMTQSTFITPPDNGSAILPRLPSDAGWFTADYANFNPTGGLWSTPDEMLRLLQALLDHQLLDKVATRKWLQPRALLPSLQQLVGISWEIVRPTDLSVNFPRPIDIYTKAGGVNGYAAYAVIIPEYDIALTIHAAGDRPPSAALELLGLVTKPLVAYADQLARSQAAAKYAGTYRLAAGNSTGTVTLTANDGPGIAITNMTINNVPVLKSFAAMEGVALENLSARLYPTDPDSLGTTKESWRMLLDQKTTNRGFAELNCAGWIMGDPYRYVREPLDTFVFHMQAGRAVSLELLGWLVKLDRVA